MSDCIFCKRIAGGIPWDELIRTEKVVSFLDINPVNPGHALIVPKRHVSTLLAVDPAQLPPAHGPPRSARRTAQPG